MNALTQTAGRSTLEPKTFDEAMRFASMLAKSTMVPRDFQNKPENILVAVQWGREIGLGTLQALQSIAIINGRPSVWGDAMLALVRGSGLCAEFSETIEGDGDKRRATCRAVRRDTPGVIEGVFSVEDAKKAGLWGKAGPWQQYPDRMLKLRARGFCVRDAFPDVLRGVISAEEAADIPTDPPTVTVGTPTITVQAEVAPEPKRKSVSEWLDALELELRGATTSEAVMAIYARDDVRKADERLTNGAHLRLTDMLDAALARTAPALVQAAEEDDGWPGAKA